MPTATIENYFLGFRTKRLDLANVCVVGIPWDASSTFRKGSREAPAAIREVAISQLYDPFTEEGSALTGIWRIHDYGDVEAAESIHGMRQNVHEVIRRLHVNGRRFIFLGGDHLTTYFCLHALTLLEPAKWALIYLDSHLDLLEECEGDRYSHGSVVRRLVEETSLDPSRIAEVGVRSCQPSERDFVDSVGINVMSTVEFRSLGARRAAEQALHLLPSDVEKVYLSVDLDILDPAYAPALGYPEPGGISTRDLIDFIHGLRGLEMAAFDVVELCPKYDCADITAISVGKLILEVLGIMPQTSPE